jgi:branched-chain amino acid transport system substrate-binding protein
MGIQSPSISNAPLRIGYSISLSGPLGVNGRSARLAHRLWEEDVNRRGGLLGRRVGDLIYPCANAR